MSNNLDLEQVLENAADKEVLINTATAQLDAALTEQFVVDLSAGNVTVADLDYRQQMVLVLDGVATSGRVVTLPTIAKLSMVIADVGNSDQVKVKRGTAEFMLDPGQTAFIYTDGTTNGMLTYANEAGAAKPYDIGTFCVGLPGASEKLLRYAFVRDVDWPANLTGSVCKAGTAATAQTDFVVSINGVNVGTVRFAIAGTTATYVGFSAESIVIGDVIQLLAPASPDATLADISFTFAGTLA